MNLPILETCLLNVQVACLIGVATTSDFAVSFNIF